MGGSWRKREGTDENAFKSKKENLVVVWQVQRCPIMHGAQFI